MDGRADLEGNERVVHLLREASLNIRIAKSLYYLTMALCISLHI